MRLISLIAALSAGSAFACDYNQFQALNANCPQQFVAQQYVAPVQQYSAPVRFFAPVQAPVYVPAERFRAPERFRARHPQQFVQGFVQRQRSFDGVFPSVGRFLFGSGR